MTEETKTTGMPADELRAHVLGVLNYVANTEPQFKNHFVENCTEDGSNEAIEASLNDPEIEHIWKSAYLALQFFTGNVEIVGDDEADEISDNEQTRLIAESMGSPY
jgi:hypothetical protein